MTRDTRTAIGHALTWGGLVQFIVLALAVGVILSWEMVLS